MLAHGVRVGDVWPQEIVRKRFPCFRVGSGPRKGRLGALWLLEIFLFCFCGGAEDRGGG